MVTEKFRVTLNGKHGGRSRLTDDNKRIECDDMNSEATESITTTRSVDMQICP